MRYPAIALLLLAACGEAAGPIGPDPLQPVTPKYVRLSLTREAAVSPRVAGLAFSLSGVDSVNPGDTVAVVLAATVVPAGTEGAMAMTATSPTVVGIKQDGVLIDPLSFTVGDSVPYLWTVPTTVGTHTLVGDYVDGAGAHQTVGTITLTVRDTTTPVDTTWTITAAWDTVEVPRASGGTFQLYRNLIPVLHELHNGAQAAYYRLYYLTASGQGQPLQVDSLPVGCSDSPANGLIYCDDGAEGRVVVSIPAGIGPWYVEGPGSPVLDTLPAPAATVAFWLHAGAATTQEPPPCTNCE